MPISKGPVFNERDVYVDYPSESVMFRWDHSTRKIYGKFYGEDEGREPVPHENRLFNDALLYGEEISESDYLRGREP